MAVFNYKIDTQDLAQELGNVTKNVDAATDAVVSLQSAVIAAEERAAKHLCDNVNRGFYSLIHSQISQKIAKFKSEFESKRMLLAHQKKALLAIKTRMERDYHMISSRYEKLFSGLNRILQTRIFELDKPLVDFSYRDVGKISNRTKSLSATVPVTQLESITSSQIVVASDIKRKCFNVINSSKKFIQEMKSQEEITKRVLVDDYSDKSHERLMPVLMYEFIKDRNSITGAEVIFPQNHLTESFESSISEILLSDLDRLKMELDNPQWIEIQTELNKQIMDSKASARVKEVAHNLFAQNFSINNI